MQNMSSCDEEAYDDPGEPQDDLSDMKAKETDLFLDFFNINIE